jgi:hypothetical protein
MAIPETSQQAMYEAIRQYDAGERSPHWRESRGGWMSNAAHKYAILHDGRHYPVKESIRLAIHASTGDRGPRFSGGEAAANRYVRNLHFEIVPLQKSTTR